MAFAFENQTQVVPGGRLQEPTAATQGFAFERQPESQVQDQPPRTRQRVAQQPEMVEHAEDLGVVETLIQSFERGHVQQEQSVLAGKHALQSKLGNDTTHLTQEIMALEHELRGMGQATEQWASFRGVLEMLGQFAGQFSHTLTSPEMVTAVGASTAAGAGIGALGGGVGALPGAGVGAGIGFFGALGEQSGLAMAGEAYLEAIREGVSEETASTMGLILAIPGGALDVVGAIPGAKVLTEPAKQALKAGFRKALKDKGMKALIKEMAARQAGAMTAEGLTEVAQEAMIITGVELARRAEGMDPEDFNTPENVDRMMQAFAQGVIVSGALTTTANGGHLLNNYRMSRKASNDAEVSLQAATRLQTAPVAKAQPEVVAQHVGEVMTDAGTPTVGIEPSALFDWAEANGVDAEQLVSDLGVASQIMDRIDTNQELTIGAEQFAQYIMLNPAYKSLSANVRFGENEFTAAEAGEWVQSGMAEEIQAVEDEIRTPGQPPADPDIEIASLQVGLDGMFKTADEAGYSEGQFTQYLTDLERAKEGGRLDKAQRQLRKEEKRLTKSWKSLVEQEAAIVRDELRDRMPVYASQVNIPASRLDSKVLKQVAADLGLDFKALPKAPNGLVVHAAKGYDPHLYAQEHGYRNAEAMLWDWATTQPYEDAVQSIAQERAAQLDGELLDRRDRILQDLQDLHNVHLLDALGYELAALNHARKAGQVSPKLLKKYAAGKLRSMPVKDITFHKLSALARKAGRDARKALRANDRDTAATRKAHQIIYTHMAKDAIQLQDRAKRDLKYMQRFEKDTKRKGKARHDKMGVHYLAAIRDLLGNVGVLPQPGKKRMAELERVANSRVDPANIPREWLDANKTERWDELTLDEWNSLVDAVKTIEKNGRKDNKMWLASQEATAEQKRMDVVAEIQRMKQSGTPGREPTWFTRAGRFTRAVIAPLWTSSTILEAIGPLAYKHIKGPMDLAMNHGYHPGQVGYLKRSRDIAQKLNDLYDKHWTRQERAYFREEVEVPGVGWMTKEQRLAVILNMGNADGRLRLENNGYGPVEQGLILKSAEKRDVAFAQDVWDMMDSFWDEIVEASQRRNNITPKRVEPVGFEHEGVTYKGGYYPLRYDQDSTGQIDGSSSPEQMAARILKGSIVASHTNQGHLQARQENPGRPLALDTSVIYSHLDSLARDLELSDALKDVHKVLYGKGELKANLAEKGHRHLYDMLDVWFSHHVIGEQHSRTATERALRHVRTGMTVAGIGFNITTAALQPLGVLQTAALVGKKETFMAVNVWRRAVQAGKLKELTDWIRSQDGFMDGRYEEFNKELLEARRGFHLTFMDKNAKTAALRNGWLEGAFWMIKKMQLQVDTITWLAGYHKAMKEGKSHEQAASAGTRAVSDSQGSGIFTERSTIERGTLSKHGSQQEIIRSFTVLSSYFIAKYNVARRRIGRTPLSLMGVADLIVDMVNLFLVEAILGAIVRQLLTPSDWTDDDAWEELPERMAWDVAGTAISAPFAREIVSNVRGFGGGGTIGSYGDRLGRSLQEWVDGDFEVGDVKAAADVAGPIFHFPSAAVNRYILDWFEE